jgi:hypothetical protein
MATKIILKKSTTAGAVPLTTDLEIGEVALNLADRKLYTKNNSNTVVPVGSAYVSATAPTGPAEGDLWYDSGTDTLKAFNGTAWASAGYATLAALEDTTIDSVADGELLRYDGTTSKWINNTLAEAGIAAASHTHTSAAITDFEEAVEDLIGANVVAGTGISVSYNDTTGTTTVTNSAPDQTVAITAGTAITVTGTYPNFTVAHTDTSTQASVDNTGATFIQDVTLDTNGHVTALGSVTVTPALIGAAPTAHTHTASQITDFNEAAQDAIGNNISGAGIAVVTYNDTAGTITVTATEADTLDSVTTRGATTTNGISVGSVQTTGDVTVGGNLIVNGTTTTVNSNTVNIGDNIIVLNSDETGTPSQNAGFEVERGTSANVQFIWNETNDAWDMGDYTLQNVRLDGGTY